VLIYRKTGHGRTRKSRSPRKPLESGHFVRVHAVDQFLAESERFQGRLRKADSGLVRCTMKWQLTTPRRHL
jgi:hypothetical protein